MIIETPTFLKSGNYRLFCINYRPEKGHCTDAIILCQPFIEEHLSSLRVLVNFARTLAFHGYHALRFDYMGYGDSEGNFEDTTVESMINDIDSTVKYLKHSYQLKKVGLFGIRFGSTLAALAAEKGTAIDFLIHVAPIVDGNSYIDQCLRSNLATQMTIYRKIVKTRDQLVHELISGGFVNIDGYLLSRELYTQVKNINLVDQIKRKDLDVLLLQISKETNRAINELYKKLVSLYSSEQHPAAFENIQGDMFWTEGRTHIERTENMYSTTIKWLNEKI